MLTVHESSHSLFWNNASEVNHWEIEIRCYNSLGSFLESKPGTLVERLCQHPPTKQSDSFVKLPHILISFAFLLSSQNWRVRCSPKKAEFISSFMNLGFYFGEKLTSIFPELLHIWGSGKAERHATVFTSSSICMKKTSVMVCQRKLLGSKPSC